MANTERKARKRAGLPFARAAKVGTPIEERYIPTVSDRNGRSRGAVENHWSKRILKARLAAVKIRDVDKPVVEEAPAPKKARAKKAA